MKEEKKLFLLNSALLYQELIKQTTNDCLRRFLAFRIIVNATSYEELINDRKFRKFRGIRDKFLSHKQEGKFFEAFGAADYIRDENVSNLVTFMIDNLQRKEMYRYFPEIVNNYVSFKFNQKAILILKKFEKDFHSGFRISNNFLCNAENQITEISSNPISSVFYRYNSTKELAIFSNYFISCLEDHNDFINAFRNFKIDYILHIVNMNDCIFKDSFNRYSIDGLYEAMKNVNIGNVSELEKLKSDTNFNTEYTKLRTIRNHIAGHIDKNRSLTDLIIEVDNYDFQKAFDFYNQLDSAIKETSFTHPVLKTHALSCIPIKNENIIEMKGLKNIGYFELGGDAL